MDALPFPGCMYWVEMGRLAGSCIPGGPDDVRAIRGFGIRRVVVLPEEFEIAERWGRMSSYFEALSLLGLDYIHEPIADMDAPTPRQLVEILRWIREGAGVPTLVHCVGGIGRTGTVISAWLIVERQMSAGDAIGLVRSLRPGSIQSYNQVRFLLELEENIEKIRKML